jgi:hypothetical protein
MAFRPIQRAMRISALLLLLAMGFSFGATASAAVPVSPAVSVAASDEGCGASFGAACLLMCRQAPAGAQGHHQTGAQPLPACMDTAARSGAAVVWRDAWSPTATVGIGPPAYLTFRRLLL